MDNILSGYLWGYKKWEAADVSFRKFKEFYPNSNLFCRVDLEGDYDGYKNICDKWEVSCYKNDFQIGYCGDFTSHLKTGREYWPVENAFEWLDNLYYICKKSFSKYMIVLEEDVFILNNISILKEDFDAAIMRTENIFHPRILNFINSFNGNIDSKLYGCCGGCIINVKKFIYSWELCREKLWEEYYDIANYTKTIGWVDCILQVVIQCGGGKILINEGLIEPWMEEKGWSKGSWKNYEIVNYLKDMEEIKKL